MFTVDRGALGMFYAQVLNQTSARFSEMASEKIKTTRTDADADNQASVVESDDPEWQTKEYGTFHVAPDPWAIPIMMGMNNG